MHVIFLTLGGDHPVFKEFVTSELFDIFLQ